MQRLLALGLVLCCAVAHAEPEVTPVSNPLANPSTNPEDDLQLYHCKDKTGPVAVTFKPETELKDLITWVMGFTCKNFILDPRIVSTGKKVTVIAPLKMSQQEAYRVFLVALSTMGLTVVPKGNVLRIVESVDREDARPCRSSRRACPPTRTRWCATCCARRTRRLEQLPQRARRDQVAGRQRPGRRHRCCIITDYASQVRDMLTLAKAIDVPGNNDGIYTIPVKYADADKVSKKLEASSRCRSRRADKMAPAALPSKILVDRARTR